MYYCEGNLQSWCVLNCQESCEVSFYCHSLRFKLSNANMSNVSLHLSIHQSRMLRQWKINVYLKTLSIFSFFISLQAFGSSVTHSSSQYYCKIWKETKKNFTTINILLPLKYRGVKRVELWPENMLNLCWSFENVHTGSCSWINTATSYEWVNKCSQGIHMRPGV